MELKRHVRVVQNNLLQAEIGHFEAIDLNEKDGLRLTRQLSTSPPVCQTASLDNSRSKIF